MKTKIGTEVAHVTRDSDTTFKVKRSRSPGRFRHRRQAAAAVDMGTCWPYETAATFTVCSAEQGASAPTEEERGGGISWQPLAYSLLSLACMVLFYFFAFYIIAFMNEL